jgi:hypothetical protein
MWTAACSLLACPLLTFLLCCCCCCCLHHLSPPQTSEPSLEEATAFAKAIHEKFPGKLLAYNCSPSFNWKKKLDDATIAKFQSTLGALGYKFQVGDDAVLLVSCRRPVVLAARDSLR